MSSKTKHKSSQKEKKKGRTSSKKSNNGKSNKRHKSSTKKLIKNKTSQKGDTGKKSDTFSRHLNSVKKSIKARQDKKKKKKKSQYTNNQNNKKPSYKKPSYKKPSHKKKKKAISSKKKVSSKTKNIKSNKSPKGTYKRKKRRSDRLHIQRKRDIEMAKKRLHKKRISGSTTYYQQSTLQSTLQLPSNNKFKVSSNHKSMEKSLWNEYIAKYGNAPQNASQIHNFSKIRPNYKTLSYKDANVMFKTFTGTKPTMQNMNDGKEKQDSNTMVSTAVDSKTKDSKAKDVKGGAVVKRRLSQTKMLKSRSYYYQDEIKNEIKNDIDEQKKKSLNENKRKSKSTIDEIKAFMESERIYVYEGLSVGLNTFLNRLEIHNQVNKSIISEKDIHLIFTNYHTLCNINSKLYDDLKELSLNNGVNKLVYNFGQKMVDFIPYFKMYTDYIVKKQAGIAHLEHLKKSNKAFKEFLKINELVVKTKLKLLLEEPAHRLPQYLEYLVNIYTSYKHEATANSRGEKLLLQSIADIKKVSDEIAIKCRDLRSRLLVGSLVSDFFGNRINLLSAHRFCIAYSSMDMLLYDRDKIKCYKFILLNDIFLISSLPSTFKCAHLKAVYPLIGLRISRNINIGFLSSRGYKINLLPSNIIIIFQNQEKMEKWMDIIRSAVDKQEHSLKQCNIVDLEKRVRKQKTSKEGQNETIAITNPDRIKAIEKWKQKRLSSASIPTAQKVVTKTRPRRSQTISGIKKRQKKSILKKLSSFRSNNSSDDIDDVKQNNKKVAKVRVMRDEEVLQFDEEIPMENFMKALNSGFVKITNEEEQNEQYKKAADTAKNLVDSSLQSYRASVFSDHWDSSDSDDDWD